MLNLFCVTCCQNQHDIDVTIASAYAAEGDALIAADIWRTVNLSTVNTCDWHAHGKTGCLLSLSCMQRGSGSLHQTYSTSCA